jgi:hypothetical protein
MIEVEKFQLSQFGLAKMEKIGEKVQEILKEHMKPIKDEYDKLCKLQPEADRSKWETMFLQNSILDLIAWFVDETDLSSDYIMSAITHIYVSYMKLYSKRLNPDYIKYILAHTVEEVKDTLNNLPVH